MREIFKNYWKEASWIYHILTFNFPTSIARIQYFSHAVNSSSIALCWASSSLMKIKRIHTELNPVSSLVDSMSATKLFIFDWILNTNRFAVPNALHIRKVNQHQLAICWGSDLSCFSLAISFAVFSPNLLKYSKWNSNLMANIKTGGYHESNVETLLYILILKIPFY